MKQPAIEANSTGGLLTRILPMTCPRCQYVARYTTSLPLEGITLTCPHDGAKLQVRGTIGQTFNMP